MRAWKTTLLIMIFSASGAIAQQSTATPPAELAPSQEPAAPAPPQLPPAPPSPQTSDLSQDAPAPAMPAPTPAQSIPAPSMPAQNMDQVIDRAIEREHALLKMMHSRTPLVETYVQDVKAIRQGGSAFTEDHYFLGRLDLAKAVNRHDYLRGQRQMLGGFSNPLKRQYNPMGFSWMIFADRTEFDRKHYKFNYLRREFLGDVRCIVFDVVPKRASAGRFVGRIWVEDQQYNIVRLNGSYVPTTTSFRMDSWRLNLIPGYWIRAPPTRARPRRMRRPCRRNATGRNRPRATSWNACRMPGCWLRPEKWIKFWKPWPTIWSSPTISISKRRSRCGS